VRERKLVGFSEERRGRFDAIPEINLKNLSHSPLIARWWSSWV
jgi:hypothetical protein